MKLRIPWLQPRGVCQAKGVLGEELAQTIIDCSKIHGVITTIDPNPKNSMNISGFTTMTPNRHEAYKLAGIEEKREIQTVNPMIDEELHRVGKIIMQKYNMEFLMITLGKGGIIVYWNDHVPYHIPTKAVDVFDVSGAGDTVIAVFTAYYSMLRNELLFCAELANLAAGIVVGKRGTATVTIEEISKRATEINI